VKASIAIASGSGFHATYLLSCLLLIEAKRSISGSPKFLVMLLNTLVLSIHSVASLKSLDALSASTLSLPGINVGVIQMDLYSHQSQISFAILLHIFDCIPPIFFMYAIAVELSHIILICKFVSWQKALMPYLMAKSSSALM